VIHRPNHKKRSSGHHQWSWSACIPTCQLIRNFLSGNHITVAF
jgi:hypothetical protein